MKQEKLRNFEFLLGDWNLESRIPKSKFSEAGTDRGSGSFTRIMDDQFIQFEYGNESGVHAKGIFAWDEKIRLFRYWWFESSGSFSQATCEFINASTLAMNWHDTVLVQTFTMETPEKVVLLMQYPSEKGGYEVVLEVILTRAGN